MEFIEYYQIIRSRIWVAIMMAAAAFVVVTVYQLLPTSSWPAQGQMRANVEARRQLQLSGSKVASGNVGEADFWGTIEQAVGSRGIRDATLDRNPGIIDPTERTQTSPLQFERGKRGDYFTVQGSGPSAEAARAYVDAGMQTLAQIWDQDRLRRCQNTANQLRAALTKQQDRVRMLQAQMDRTQSGANAARPADRLTWVQGQIQMLQAQLATEQVTVDVARDRLAAYRALAQREASLPPEQRALDTTPREPREILEGQLIQVEIERSKMLLTRTPDHPQVAALDQELRGLRQRIQELESSAATTPQSEPATASALRQPIVDAEVALRAAQRRVDAIVTEEQQLRNQVPTLLDQARRYGEFESQLQVASAEKAEVDASLLLTESEIARLGDDDHDLTIETPAYSLPSPKTWPKYFVMALAASMAGFVMGCMLIFALHHIDLTFKNEVEAEQLLAYPVIAGIPRTDISFVPLPPRAGDNGVTSGPEGMAD